MENGRRVSGEEDLLDLVLRKYLLRLEASKQLSAVSTSHVPDEGHFWRHWKRGGDSCWCFGSQRLDGYHLFSPWLAGNDSSDAGTSGFSRDLLDRGSCTAEQATMTTITVDCTYPSPT